MQQCRRQHYPPNPRTIDEFVTRLSDTAYERNLEYCNGRLSVTLIIDSSGARHALLFDENFVRQQMGDVTKILIDGTFRSRPRIEGVYQLVTIMGIKLNHVSIFSYFLLFFLIIRHLTGLRVFFIERQNNQVVAPLAWIFTLLNLVCRIITIVRLYIAVNAACSSQN